MQERKIIQQSRSFKDLDRTLKKLIKNKKVKLAGSIFEYLTKLFLEVSPEYKTKLKKVYLLNEIPIAVKRKLKLPNTDEGIDLIAETFDNEYWAIQCKYRSDKTETLKVKGDLATFNNLAFTVCKNISHGLIAATVNRPPQKKQLLKVGYILLNEWLKLDRDGGELFEQIKHKAAGKIVKPKKLSPRPHQKEAISKTISYFKSNERGKMIMPCGTGKSLTAFWIAEKMKPKSILIAVPSLALLQQTLKVWTREFLLNNIEPDWLCVCSDDTVKEEQDDFVTFSADLGIKVDTDPRVIRNFLRKKTKKLKIVFTTYQSGRATAIGSKGFKYDLGIMDEAHKTVGSGKKPMAHLLHQNNIKINKRLFMTATERLFRGDSDEYMSMDDPRDYGNLIYELSFKKAINSKPPIISDYKIITFGITTPEIEKIAEDNKYLEVKRDLKDITARELATAIALRKAIKKLKIKNAISFHRSIKRAENFRKQQDLISKIYPTYGKLKTFHVRGDMPTSDRALEMLSFEEEKGLMTNARCLTEGVDLPAIDCVCFTDPKRSKVDIVQAAGRALRLSKDKKFGYILIPIYISDGVDFNEAAKEQGFEDVSTTVRALSTTDTRIVEYLKAISEGKKPVGGSPVEGVTSINKLYKVEADEFDKAVKLKIWNKVAKANYMTFEEAKRFVKENNIISNSQFRNFQKPKDMPSAPDFTYKFKGWKNWGDFFGTGRVADQFKWKEALPIEQIKKVVKKIVKELKIKSVSDWRRNIITIKKNYPSVPTRPDLIYSRNGWNGWGDFLGTDIVSTQDKNFVSYEKARNILKKNKINNWEKYENFAKIFKIKINNKIHFLPSLPNRYYKNYNKLKFFNQTPIYEYNKAKEFIKKYKFKSIKQYQKFVKTNKITYLPLTPLQYYRIKGSWRGTEDFLSKDPIFLNYDEASKIVKKLNLQSSKNFFELGNKRPKNIPSAPSVYYKKRGWVNWGHFLGSNVIAPYLLKYKYINFYKLQKLVRKHGIKTSYDYQRFIKSKKFKFIAPANPDMTPAYKKYWKSWPDFLGKI